SHKNEQQPHFFARLTLAVLRQPESAQKRHPSNSLTTNESAFFAAVRLAFWRLERLSLEHSGLAQRINRLRPSSGCHLTGRQLRQNACTLRASSVCLKVSKGTFTPS